MGLIHPKIYLPSSLGEREQSYVVMHEQHHIRRLDHIVKVLAFIVLSIHWFNPLVWLAFVMAGRDMEMSCDEAVIRKMGDGVLADYAASLLSLATGKHIIAGMPLAFGEGDTKGRIRNLANWKKPAVWVVLAAVIACAILAICLLTNPQSHALPFDLGTLQISWAKTLDCRPNEPTSFDLNDSELDELKSRLAGLDIGRQDDDLAGFTPYYSISIQASGYSFSVQGFDLDGTHIALYYQGKYYRIHDSEFSQYLRNICAGGTRASAEEAFPTVQEWFDFTDNPSDAYEYTPLYADLPEFPNATFRYAGNIAVSDGDAFEARVLITGMPIWNAYFCDLTGDNLPEICATLSIGSGMIDNRIIIYDYANGVSYELEDRGNHDYTLSLQDGKLIVTKCVYNSSTVVETGYLAYLNHTIQIIPWTIDSTESLPSTADVS